jgi:hypothetical protein
MEAKMPEARAVERIKQLEAEKTKLVAAARKEALARANQAVADLVALGFTYRLVDGNGSRAPRKAARRKGAGRMGDHPCPVCEFKTSPPHDARKHRFVQGKRKHAFTAKELTDLGLKKVG